MRISQLVQELINLQLACGDVEVAIVTDTPEGEFHVEHEMMADVIELPKSDYEPDKYKAPICALAWRHVLINDDVIVEQSKDPEANVHPIRPVR